MTVHDLPAVFQMRNISPRVEEALGRAMIRLMGDPDLAHSVPPRLPDDKRPAQRRRLQIMNLHDKGKTAREIADALKIDASTVWTDLKRMGIKPNRRPPKRAKLAEKRRKKVAELMDAGMKLGGICRILEQKEHIIKNDILLIRERRKGDA